MVCLFYGKKQIAHYVNYTYNPIGSLNCMPHVQIKHYLCDVCNKIIVNVLWYSYFVARNKLLIISTNPTGNNLTANVFWQMLCTLSNRINVLWYVQSIAWNKLLIMSIIPTMPQSVYIEWHVFWPIILHLKFVTKFSWMYWGGVLFIMTLLDGKISINGITSFIQQIADYVPTWLLHFWLDALIFK